MHSAERRARDMMIRHGFAWIKCICICRYVFSTPTRAEAEMRAFVSHNAPGKKAQSGERSAGGELRALRVFRGDMSC